MYWAWRGRLVGEVERLGHGLILNVADARVVEGDVVIVAVGDEEADGGVGELGVRVLIDIGGRMGKGVVRGRGMRMGGG